MIIRTLLFALSIASNLSAPVATADQQQITWKACGTRDGKTWCTEYVGIGQKVEATFAPHPEWFVSGPCDTDPDDECDTYMGCLTEECEALQTTSY